MPWLAFTAERCPWLNSKTPKPPRRYREGVRARAASASDRASLLQRPSIRTKALRGLKNPETTRTLQGNAAAASIKGPMPLADLANLETTLTLQRGAQMRRLMAACLPWGPGTPSASARNTRPDLTPANGSRAHNAERRAHNAERRAAVGQLPPPLPQQLGTNHAYLRNRAR